MRPEICLFLASICYQRYKGNIEMRLLFVLIVTLSLSVGVTACGSASQDANSRSTASSDGVVSGGASVTPYHGVDRVFVDYGQPASSEVRDAVVGVVARYYKTAVAGDGSAACSQMVRILVKAVPIDVGQAGPRYARGGKTCGAVMVAFFRHFHRQLLAGVQVTGVRVRVRGKQALALLGSRAMPARYITVQWQDGAWKIAQTLGVPLP